MTINNFNQIKSLLNFESTDDFYIVEAIRRRKDNPDHPNNMSVLKTWFIRDLEHYDRKKWDIIDLCDHYNARGYIRLNKRSFNKTALETLRLVANLIADKQPNSIRSVVETAAGRHHNEPNKKWIFDIDNPTVEQPEQIPLEFVKDEIESIAQTDINWNYVQKGSPIIAEIPTRNGVHLITKPFNISKFEYNGKVDVHKDNPTILYIP